MNKIWSLVKIDLIHSYSINKLNKRHNQQRKLGSLIATIILGALLFISVSTLMLSMGVISKEVNQLDFILVFGYTIASFMTFTVTISKANSLLFEGKDFELLMSMPINTKTIVLSKLISLLLINYLSFGLILVPCIAVYGILSKAGIIFFILGLVTLITGPLLIVSICSLISYLLGLALKKVKSKSIIMSIFSLVIFVFVFFLYTSFANKMGYTGDPNLEKEYFEEFFSTMKENFMLYYPISKFMALGLSGNWLYYLYYLLIMIVPFVLLVVFVGKNFLKANMRAKITFTNKNYKLKEQKQNSKIISLMKRDFKRFFSSSAQVLNIGIGPIMSTIMLVFMIFSAQPGTGAEEQAIFGDLQPIMLLLSAGFAFGLMPSTASAISLEGKNFWILKSSPIKTKDVFISKILFYLIICFPFIIINTVIISIMSNLKILNIILVFIIQILIVSAYSVEGLWINILAPKFDWDNEVKAIKQGTGSLLAMLVGLGLGLVLYITPIIFTMLGINGLLILLLNSIVVLTIMSLILFTNGKKKYEKIQA